MKYKCDECNKIVDEETKFVNIPTKKIHCSKCYLKLKQLNKEA